MTKPEKILLCAAIAYVIAAIFTFGHASVRQDRLEAEYKAQCTPGVQCHYWRSGAEGIQAMFWPFYVSYIAWGGK